jgi:septal ring factor EnvC (AmiA/AmiB activator)
MRVLFYLYLLVLLCGCASQPLPAFLTPRDQQLFVQGMAEVNAKRELPAAFTTLKKTYPESPWTQKAQAISALLETIRSQQKSIARLERDKASFRQENKALQQKNEVLENDRKKLRQLLIDLEKRSR